MSEDGHHLALVLAMVVVMLGGRGCRALRSVTPSAPTSPRNRQETTSITTTLALNVPTHVPQPGMFSTSSTPSISPIAPILVEDSFFEVVVAKVEANVSFTTMTAVALTFSLTAFFLMCGLFYAFLCKRPKKLRR